MIRIYNWIFSPPVHTTFILHNTSAQHTRTQKRLTTGMPGEYVAIKLLICQISEKKILSMLSELFPRPRLQPTLNKQPSPLKSILNSRLYRKPERKMFFKSVCSAVSTESLKCLSSCWFFQTSAVFDCFTVCQVKDPLRKTGMILRHENGSVVKKV